MKKLLIALSLLFLFQTSMAHKGGHGEKEQHSNDRTWYFEDRTIATEGSFLLVKKDEVYIENNEKIISLKIEKLSWTDQEYIKRKEAHIATLNEQIAQHESGGPGYVTLWLLIGTLVALIILAIISIRSVYKPELKRPLSAIAVLVILVTAISCGSDDEIIEEIEELISAISNPETINQAFAPYSDVTTSWDDEYFYVASNGIPDHQMMVGITAWIAQVPIPQPYTDDNAWSIPLNTKYAENPISIDDNFQRGAIGIAANGIPIFNPINASGLISNEIGELDPFGGHSGRGDDYHYHTAPTHLESTSGTNPIAYALDGYAVYGSTEPDGSAMTDLDEYHGHEYADGSYHYHGTETYPYMIAAMRGEVTLEGDAPQNQVTPQPMADPPRGGDPHPINGDNLIITNLVAYENSRGYILSYTIDGVAGSVDYSWNENDFYTFIFNDVDGSTTTETFQR